MKNKPIHIVLLFSALLLTAFQLVIAGNVAREFNIFAPPLTEDLARVSFIMVTAVIGNDYVTEVDIIDRLIADVDNDSDDTYRDLELTQGQSYIVFLKEGDVNDSYGGVMDGDYFKIQANRRIQTAIGTLSDWEFDYVPPYFHSDGSVDFFVYVPNGSAADEWGLNVIGYRDNTSVLVEDITNTPTTGSGYTSVTSVGSGSQIWSGTINKSEDLLIRKDIDLFDGIDPRGRTFYIQANDSVAVIAGALRQAHSARDGASYVKNGEGLNVGKEFFFYIPLDQSRNDEKEIRVNTYSEAATVNLWCWDGTQWDQLATDESMTAYDHFDYIGSGAAGYSQNFFKLTSTGKVGVFTATWLETGATGTSDMATYISSEYGYGAGHNYIVYLGPPGYEGDHGTWSHAYITTIDSNTTVTIKDMDTDGGLIDTSVVLNNNDFFDFKIDQSMWNQLSSGGNRPYIKVYSAKDIRIMDSNWNDNWFAYAAGISVPQYSELSYVNMPFERWVFLTLPMDLDYNNPDSVFADYFGGPEGGPEPDINTNWRFSRWSIDYNTYVRWGETDYDGGNHGEPPLPIPGRGYWFYQRHGSAIELPISGSIVDTTEDYYIQLNPPIGDHDGLNQVGNPFPFVIDWKNTEVEVTTSSGSNIMTLPEANQQGLLDSWSYRWNGYEYVAYNAPNGGDFLTWDGFWVEQLVDSIGVSETTVDYTVGQTNNWPFLIGFYDAVPSLDNGQTDRFNITYSDSYYYSYYFYARTMLSDQTSDISNWARLYSTIGSSSVTNQGFRITVTDLGDDFYTIDVTAETNSFPLYGVEFYMYVTYTSPELGSIYSAQRNIEVSESSVSLRLKVPPTRVDRKGRETDYRYPFTEIRKDEQEWYVPISVNNSDNTIRDTYNGFGTLTGSMDHYDANDARNLTPMSDQFIDLYFPHDDISDIANYWGNRPIKAAYDIRAFSDTAYWDFNVSAWNVPSTDFTIEWESSDIPSSFNVLLLDDDNVIDMKSQSSYQFTTPSEPSSSLPFQIAATQIKSGVDSENLPLRFALLNNYPNPFNASTTLRYIIDSPANTKLSIYTIRGELVKTLVDGKQQPGRYSIIWDGTDNFGKQVSTGIYLYKIQSDGKSISKKMLILK